MCDDTGFLHSLRIKKVLMSLRQSNEVAVRTQTYYHGELVDYGFGMREGASLKEVNCLEQKIGYDLPSDYKEFLLHTNGLSFKHYDAEIFSVEDVLSTRSIFTYPDSMLAIASSMSSQLHIMIHLKDPLSMYAIDPIADESFTCIGNNFTEFLNRFVMCYGADYWNWSRSLTKKIPKEL
ncbi:SMI1/KNR4 family protein [Sporosarcina cyprini]|uniref:SMI1/KNR4 family protein n=1 Tax=Sporosarcina cyprini TaxID=2910523 RepID=UPI001EDF52E5|nr:SMI1/KNR4 family protein [Sporosarcina cyprini]MCG3089296.1 SMI1/KNR4 family protein [Sporosarcina cyprini]